MSSAQQTSRHPRPASSVLQGSDVQDPAKQITALKRENAQLSDRLFLLTQQLSEKDRALNATARCLEEVENLFKRHLEMAG